MAKASLIDTHQMVKRLVGSGMPESQAETVTDLVKESQESSLARFVTAETLRLELQLQEQRLVIKLGSMIGAAVVLVGALVALF